MMGRFLALVCLSGILLGTLLTALGLTLTAGNASAATLTVDDDVGPWAEYNNIQAAIDNATDGDWIYVFEGNYNENVHVNRSVTLYGNGTDRTSVVVTGTVFNVTANATITHMSIEDGTYGVLCTAPVVRLRDLEFPTIDSTAIDITGAATALMTRVNITSGTRGIEVSGSDNVTIRNTSISGVTLFSIDIYESEDVTVREVTVTGSQYAINLAKDTNDTVVRGVEVHTASNGIMLKDNVNVTIADSLIVDCTDGIPITEGFEVAIDNVTIDGATDAITVSEGTVTMVDMWVDGSVQRHIDTDRAKVSIADSWFTRCDGAFASFYFKDSSAEIVDVLHINAEHGFGFESSWSNITNSTMNVSSMDFELIDGSVVDTLNVTFTNNSVDSSSTFTQRNFLTLYSRNSQGAIEGVDAQITDDGSDVYVTEAYGGTDAKTGSSGMIWMVQVRYRTWTSGAVTYHDIDAAMALGPWSELRDVNMFFSHTETFTRPYGMDIYVDDNATGIMNGSEVRPYDTIEDAYTNGTDGDTIHIAPGIYHEFIVMAKGIDFVGAEPYVEGTNATNWTIYSYVFGGFSIDSDSSLRNITVKDFFANASVTASNITVLAALTVNDHLALTNSHIIEGEVQVYPNSTADFSGVDFVDGRLWISGPGPTWMRDITFMGETGVVRTWNAEDITFETSELMDATLERSEDITMRNSSIESLRLMYSESTTLRNSTIGLLDISGSIFGDSIDYYVHDIDSSNTVDGEPIAYIISNHSVFDASGYGYLGLVNCSGMTVSGLEDASMLIAMSMDMNIESALNASIFSSGSYPIYLNRSHFSSIEGWSTEYISMNSTFDDIGGWDRSTLTEKMWLQVVVENSLGSPLEGVDIEVTNETTMETTYASVGYGGNDPQTNAYGKGQWSLIPGSVTDANGTTNLTYRIRFMDHGSENGTVWRGGYPAKCGGTLPAFFPRVNVTHGGSESGLHTFFLNVSDANHDPVSIETSWQIDKWTYGPMTTLNGTGNLTANGSGVNHTIVWDSLADLPDRDGRLRVYFTPWDPYERGNGDSLRVTLNNSDLPHPPTVELLTPPDDAVVNSTSIMFSWLPFDHDGDAIVNRLFVDNGTEVRENAVGNMSSCTVHNLTEVVTYEWWVEVSDGTFNTTSERRNFTIDTSSVDRNPPVIVHTPITSAQAGVALTINAYVYDDVGVENVTLHYGKGASWKTAAMVGEVVFGTSIPASDMTGNLSYYMVASDGRNSVTSPLGDPYEVVVSEPDDDLVPVIEHTTPENWTYGEPLVITANVTDDRYVDVVELRYADPRYPYDFSGKMMDRVAGNHMDGTYSAVIPGFAVVPAGVEYYIRATDGVNEGTLGSRSEPLNVTVVMRDRILTTNLSFTDGYIVVRTSIVGPGDLDVGSTADPSGGARTDIGLFFTIEIDDPSANVTWVSIEVHYGDVPKGVRASELRLYHWDAGDEAWRRAGITGVDVQAGFVWANTTHLTIFAPLEIADEEESTSIVPLLAIGLIVAVAIFLAVVYMRHRSAFRRIRERADKVTCPRCRSEVEDNISHRCPECGALLPKGSQEEAWEKRMDGPDAEDDGKGLRPLPPRPGAEPDDAGPDFPMGVPRKPGEGADITEFEDAGHVDRYGPMKAPEKSAKPAVPGARPGPERRDDLGGLRDASEPVETPEWEEAPEEPDGDAEGPPAGTDVSPEWEGGEERDEDVPDVPSRKDRGGPTTPEWEGSDGTDGEVSADGDAE